MVHNQEDLCVALEVEGAAGVSNLIESECEWTAWVELEPHRVEIRVQDYGSELLYPFPLEDFWAAFHSLETIVDDAAEAAWNEEEGE